MKLNVETITWFDRPIKEEKLTATLGSNGRLIISKSLQDKLPNYVEFGFDASSRTLLIAESQDRGYKKQQSVMIRGLTSTILETGMKLPIHFDFEYDTRNNWWCGHVHLRKRNAAYDTEQLLTLYKPLADKLFHKIGKTTPKEDRRQIIALAFCEAAKEYSPVCGNFELFLMKKAKTLVQETNHQYVQQAQTRSMEASLIKHAHQSNFNLYSTIQYNDCNFSAVDTKIMNQQFEAQLSKKELAVYKLVQERRSICEISERLDISAEEIHVLAKTIGLKRKRFYTT